MDYSYLQSHERQEGRPAPENGRGHPQNQYPVHCEHQQYPTGHQVMSTGYPSGGFASYIHPIQAPITSANAGMSSQDGLHPPRMLAQDSTRRISSSSSTGMPFRTESQQSTHLQQILQSVALQPKVMQSNAVFHNLDRSIISQHDRSRASSGHSSHTISSSGQSLVAEVRPPNPRPQNLNAHFQDNHTVVSQHDVVQNAQTASLSLSHGAVGVTNQASDVSQHERLTPSVNRPLQEINSRARVLKPLRDIPQAQENLTRPVALSVSSGLRPPEISSALRPLEVTSQMDSKSCQTEPLFDMLPVAARTLSRSFDLIEGFSYKMPGHEPSPGVVVTKDLQAGEEFGPFTGEFVDDDCGIIDPTSWEVCVRGKPGLYISGTCDPNNWMAHVQVARCREEQNMEAFQFYGDIFFRTTKAIEAGTELRVFYSKDYCRKVGLVTGLEELSFDQGFGRFRCTSCENHYSNAKSLLRHIKFEHDKENIPVTPQTRTEQHSSRTEQAGQSARPILQVKQEMILVSEMGSTSKDPTRKGEKRKSCDVSGCIQVKFVPPKLKKSSVMLRQMEDIHPFVCNLCQKQFPSKGKLDVHAAFHKDVRGLVRLCNECGAPCKGKEEFRCHMKIHKPNALQCPVCQRYYNYNKRMLAHLRSVHQYFKGKKWSGKEVTDLMTSLKVASDQQVAVTKHKGPTCLDCLQCFEDKVSFEQHECSQGTYKCQYCDKVFQKNSQMVAHLHKEHKMDQNMEEHLFTCSVCQKQFPSKGTLDAHSAFHKDVRGLIRLCDKCGVSCKGKEELRRHKKLHRPNVFQCPVCQRHYNHSKRMVAHLRTVHQYFKEKKWSERDIADLINGLKVSGVQEQLDRLVILENQVEEPAFHPNLPRDMLGRRISRPVKNRRMFKCKYCPKLYTNVYHCSRHEKETHTFTGSFMCEFCSASFLTEKKYLIHKTKHTNERLYKCTECPQSYSAPGALERHIRDHLGEYPHKCDICTKGYRTRKNMLAHKRRTHEPPKVLFQCQFCPKKLKNKATHRAHEKCHIGIRPHVCFTCSKAFSNTWILKRHMLIHTGEKPHECEVCKQRFRLPHQLFQHKFRHKIDERRQADKVSHGPSTSVPRTSETPTA